VDGGKKKDSKDLDDPDKGEFQLTGDARDSWRNRLHAATDLDHAAQIAAAIVGQLVDYDLFELNLLDISTGLFTPHRTYSAQMQGTLDDRSHNGYRLGEGLTGWLVEHRTPLLIGDILKEPDLSPAVETEPLKIRSFLGLPILADDDLIGTLEIAHLDSEKYTQADLETVRQIRDAIAVTLADLERNKELQAIQQLAHIQQELFDKIKYIRQLDKLVAELGNVLLARLEAEWVAFLIYNPETASLETLSPVTNRHGRLDDYRLSIPSAPDAPISSLWNSQDYWIVNEIQSDDVIERLNLGDALSGVDAERFILAPLTAGEQRIGVIVAGRTNKGEWFSEEQGTTLNSLGLICGSMLDSALDLRYELSEESAFVGQSSDSGSFRSSYTEALLRITGELAASMDLDHLLSRVLSMLRKAVAADQGAFLLSAPDTKTLILRASSGSFPPPPPGGRQTPYQSDQGLAGWVIQNQMAVCIGDLLEDERWVPFNDETPRQKSALTAPLIVSDEVLGAVLLLGYEKNQFSNDDLQLVSAAANQIAPAIHNAQLYHLIQDQAERLGLALRSQQVESSQSQAVLHAMTDGVIVTDPNYHILVFNPAAEQILGIPRTELLGQSVFGVFERFGHPGNELVDQLRTWQEDGASARSRGLPPRRIETEQKRILALQPAPVVLGEDFLGTITIVRDITREVELDRMKSEFVATVSHELRSPITPIKGFVDLLRMGASGEVSEQQARYLEIIYQNIQRLELLVDELLDISRIEAGKVVLTFEALNVEQLLDELKTYVHHRSKTEEKRMDIITHMDPDIPEIWGDPERVRQILTNLVDNSFDYTPEGGIIRIEAQGAGDQIEIAINDNGMGIAVSEQERIFERFYRGEQALIMGVAGAGLGLSIALTMVEMHGGRIWVNSAGIPGKGSTFTVSLPVTTPGSKPEKVVRNK
jgi:PAS domain S-box-containing protein